MSERQVQSSDDEQSVTGGHTTSMELAELIEDAIGQVTGEGTMGNDARHAVVERVMDQVGDPTQHAVVAGRVHARMDLG
ncbi:MAG: hypothetical protein WCA29_08455 [Jiangellales bacterium]